MVDTLQNLEHVYSKWNARSPWGSSEGARGNGSPASSKPVVSRVTNEKNDSQKDRAERKSKVNTVGPPPERRRKYQPPRTGMVSASTAVNTTISQFKREPTVMPGLKTRRPFQGRCCSCTPNSRNEFYSDSVKEAGLHNIFNVETKSEEKDWFTRRYYVMSFVVQRKCGYRYPDVSLSVLTSPRLVEAVRKTMDDSGIGFETPKKVAKKAEKKYENEAKSLLSRMSARISNRLIRLTGWFLHRSLGFLLSSILVHKGEIKMLKEASKKDAPIIYLPTHRSHLDYILITFILFNYDMKAPHVAAGDNLLIPLFGWLLRGLGGYFIRRKLDKKGKKDHLYRAVLQTYMEELLKRNASFEFFIEGGRTRSGKALYPKGGLLSVLTDACQEGVINDAQIVPVSISYDKLIDGPYAREQMGEKKESETFWRACVAIYKMFLAKYGHVRVDFAQPFSLKEYLKEAPNFRRHSTHFQGDSPVSMPDSPFSNPEKIKISPSETSLLSGSSCDEQRRTVQNLADHVVYNQIAQQPVMSTQLLAFTLLFRHRKGVMLDSLIKDVDKVRDEITGRGRDLGFCGKSADAIEHAYYLLGEDLIQKTVTTEEINGKKVQTVRLEPNLSLPHVFNLAYYGNVVTSVFATESVMATQLCAMCGTDLWTIPNGEDLVVCKEDLIECTVELCDLLKYEHIFGPPCKTLDAIAHETFDQFTNAEILLREEEDESQYRDTRERDWSRRVAASLSHFDEESDEEDWRTPETLYNIRLDERSLEKLKFLRAIVAPIIECYFITACKLVILSNNDMPEDEFCADVHKLLKERVQSGIATYAESAALDSLKNALRGFQHVGVVGCYQVAGIKMVALAQKYQNEKTLNEFISHLERFR